MVDQAHGESTCRTTSRSAGTHPQEFRKCPKFGLAKQQMLTSSHQSKCTEMIQELNHCVEVTFIELSTTRDTDSIVSLILQEILRANAYVKTAADLATKYRKNVQYNLEANKPEESQ
jgi:DASH complex subunit DAD4